MVIWNILRPFNIVYGHFCNVVIIWYIFHRFGTLCQEKSGNRAYSRQKSFLLQTSLQQKKWAQIKTFSCSYRQSGHGFSQAMA
jgi:hypothetical protein